MLCQGGRNFEVLPPDAHAIDEVHSVQQEGLCPRELGKAAHRPACLDEGSTRRNCEAAPAPGQDRTSARGTASWPLDRRDEDTLPAVGLQPSLGLRQVSVKQAMLLDKHKNVLLVEGH